MPPPTLTARRAASGRATARPAPAHSAFGRRAAPGHTAAMRQSHDGTGDRRTRLPRPRPPDDRLRGWIVTLIITAIAGATRFVMLGRPTDAGTPVFDEKHYAPQAWQMIHGGWIEDNPGYELVVHPPLAKQLMALGEWIFGYDGVGWRFASAVAGTVLVLLIIRIARRMTGSTLLAGLAGLLATADGTLTVASRTALLDIFLTVFMVGAFACLLRDRQQVIDRLARVAAEGRISASPFGPRLGFRWWRFSAGVLVGLACAAKWGGLYYVAFFGLLCVASDVAARRRFGVRRPWLGTFLRDTPAALASLVLVPLAVYLAAWWAWFASEVGVDRHVVGWKVGTGGDFSFIPGALHGLWYYSAHVLEFHEHLTNSAGNRHPWESKPWTWPMSLRPLLYYYADGDGVTGCGSDKCVSAMMIVGTPAMWWLSLPVAVWGMWRIISRRDWRYAWVFVGYSAGYLPWFLNLDRQMYFFYAVPLAPFLVLGLTLALGELLGRRAPPSEDSPPIPQAAPQESGAADARDLPHERDRPHGVRRRFRYRPGERRSLGLALVCAYVSVVVVNYVWLWPILTGGVISESHWQMELWLPSWR